MKTSGIPGRAGSGFFSCSSKELPRFSASLRLCVGGWFVSVLLFASSGFAYPEYQQFIKKHSGKPVNCAMCHVNQDGPEGTGPGQIGSLTKEQFDRLSYARGAFDPGRNVDSPILNAFGDQIIKTVGKKRFLELKKDPAGLAAALGTASDLDEDGIPDSQEFLDGTHPLKDDSGDPWKLLWVNLQRNRVELLILVLATGLGLFGLNNLLHGFASMFREEEGE